jgi:hypothetical protein
MMDAERSNNMDYFICVLTGCAVAAYALTIARLLPKE